MQIHKLQTTQQKEIMEKYQLSALCASVLAAKQCNEEEIIEILQEPKLMDPMQAKGMKEVVDRIYRAKMAKEKVMVCGDYDADGICATTILVDALKRYGIDCGFYIPNRFKEGYGLQLQTVTLANEKGYRLMITVDNGVKANDALAYAKTLGIDVIVSDHHAMDEEFPCYCLLHPQYMGDMFSTLSGAGVALEIARALIGDAKEHIVLACVAAVGDVMNIKKETRTIVKLGLTYLKQGYCLPIQMLANDRYPQWDETLLAFQIVPKLNTTGRLADMANTNNTVRYLLLQNREDIIKMAKQIENLNSLRKQMSEEMLSTARSLLHEEYTFQLLFHESFHEGMAGLVAGKLQGEIHRPVMVVARRDQMYKGSIRSGNLLDLTTFFQDIKEELSAFGGHPAAAGIGFSYEKKQVIQDYVNTRMQTIQLQDTTSYDAIEIGIEEVNLAQVESLSILAPFGNGFEEPIFYLEDVPIQEMKVLGKGQHIKWIINEQIEAMYFNCEKEVERFKECKKITFIGNLRVNVFRSKKKVSIYVLVAQY